MSVVPPEAAPTMELMWELTAPSSDADPFPPTAGCVTAPRRRLRTCPLDLSRARTHDAVLDILKAYKLSGNFHGNLEAVLNDMGVSEMVAYQVKPGPALAFPDCRHVVFTCNDTIPDDKFDDIIASIKARIGFDVPWWGKLLRRSQSEADAAAPMCHPHY
jgi:hypothetical protein